MAAFLIALDHEEQHQRGLRREIIFRDRSNPLDTFSLVHIRLVFTVTLNLVKVT